MNNFKMLCIKALPLLVFALQAAAQNNEAVKLPDSQPQPSSLADSELSETGFADLQSGGKYFQYIHNPSKDHYEDGHKRGNEHHFIEKHEKVNPHQGEFKTKVRWGDKHGGYGEHYWDYNHAGHGHEDDGEESVLEEQYAPYEEVQSKAPRLRRGSQEDVEFINEETKQRLTSGIAAKHGGNYRRISDADFRGRYFRK